MIEETIDVETIDIYLIGDQDEIAEGIRLINGKFKYKIVEIIHRRALSANTDDLFDIYQDTLLGIYEYAHKKKYEPGPTTLVSLIYKIATNKANDWLRKKFAQKRKVEIDKDVLIDSVAETISDSQIKEPWQIAQENDQRAIVLAAIRKLIPRLKPRQRQVAEIIKENFPCYLSDPDIKEQILQVYDEDISTIAVKSARKEVYEKLKDTLSNT